MKGQHFIEFALPSKPNNRFRPDIKIAAFSVTGELHEGIESTYGIPLDEQTKAASQQLHQSNHSLTRLYVDNTGRPTGKTTSERANYSGYQIVQAIASMTERDNGTPGILLATEAGLIISAFIGTFLQADRIIPPPIEQLEMHIKIGLIAAELILALFAYKQIDNFIKTLHVAQKTGLSLTAIRHIANDKSVTTSRTV